MGIRELWQILTPFCDRKPLYELQNKKVAVDLSGWVCEAQNVTEYFVQPRMYLRNLYFRTCCLLLMDVVPVFVLEGKAPEVKYKTIAARNAIQFRGAKPKSDNVKTDKGRTRFNHTLKQCEDMLKLMGLACVQGEGEAEALCAHLNSDDLVDGIISQDSDCFAYGAKVVYRNFSISTQGAHAAKGGSVDIYDITRAFESLKFGRNKVIALALLCGSDYSEGIHGVGKEAAMKLFEKYDDNQILDRLRLWRKNDLYFQQLLEKVNDKNTCTSCGHYGKVQSHNRYGCEECGIVTGCSTDYKEERILMKNEINMRKKALEDPEFPDEDLISEYITRKDNVSELDLKWKQPDMNKFIKFTVKYLTWEEIYAFEKFLPILTRWQLLNYEYVFKNIDKLKGVLIPKRIVKARTLKGIQSLEILWNNPDYYYEHCIPEEQLRQVENLEKLWSTVEPLYLVEEAFPELVGEFLESKKPKTKRKKQKKVDELTEDFNNLSIEPPVKKTKPKKKEVENQPAIKMKTIESYFTKNIKEKHSSTPVKNENTKNNISLDWNLSKFGDESDDNISDLIDSIIKRGPVIESESVEEVENNLNNSSFFISRPQENDLFERTFHEMCGQAESEDDESAEEHDGNDVDIESDEKSENNDSIYIETMPLIERLKNRLKISN